jgi:hypothetical protein
MSKSIEQLNTALGEVGLVAPQYICWAVAENGRIWSGNAGAWVAAADTPHMTAIPTIAELKRVLRMHAMPEPETVEDARMAVEGLIDAMAQARGYRSAESCVSYVSSSHKPWAAEAQAFKAWRDAVWLAVYAAQASTTPPATIADLLAELPAMAWPEAGK